MERKREKSIVYWNLELSIGFGIHTIRDKVVNKYLSTAEYSLVWNKILVMYSVISEGGGGGGVGGHNHDNLSAFG